MAFSFAVDLEKGTKRPVTHQRETSSIMSTLNAATKAHPLEVFQTLVGIEHLAPGGGPTLEPKQPQPKQPFRSIFFPSNTVHNRGLYERATSNEWKCRILCSTSNYIISGLYLLQILLAATFTALSAYQGSSSVTLTVLGAVNTVVAGILAWLKGQGMPVRFRQARDAYAEVAREIEMSERMFAEAELLNSETPNPVAERDRLEKLFEDARMDQMANYPDTHVSVSARRRDEEAKQKGADATLDVQNIVDTLMEKVAQMQQKIQEVERGVVKGVEAAM